MPKETKMLRLYYFLLALCLPAYLFASASPRTDQNQDLQETVKATYALINQNWSYPAGGEIGCTNSVYWETTTVYCPCITDGKTNTQLIRGLSLNIDKVKKYHIFRGIIPVPVFDISEAFDDLLNCKAILECTLAAKTVQIACIRHLLGTPIFNYYATLFYQTIDEKSIFFMHLPDYFLEVIQKEEAPIGTFTAITNLPEYSLYKITGPSQQHNVFRLDGDSYIGFDPVLFKEGPRSLENIENLLFEEFIRTDDVTNHHTQHLEIAHKYQSEKKTFDAERRHYQNQNNVYIRIKWQDIQEFKKEKEWVTRGVVL